MLEFKKSVLKVKLYGEEIEMRFPTVSELSEFESTSKKEGEFTSFSKMFINLGMSKKQVDSLESDHMLAIISKLSEKKS